MSHFLLPKPVLFLGILVACRLRGVEVADVLGRSNTTWGRFQWRHVVLPLLVNHLCVSRELLLVRLSQLGKFNDETAAYHRTYRFDNHWLPHTPQAPHLSPLHILKDLPTALL